MDQKKQRIEALQVTTDQAVEYEAWEKQPGEHPVWFDRFNRFRLLGPNRTIREIYRQERYSVKGVKMRAIPLGSHREWNMVANQWQWKERAESWDLHCQQIQEAEANQVFGEGYALIHNRVTALKKMAKKLEEHLLDPNVKRISPYIMEQYRGLLDDIAKEMGQRNKEVRITGAGGGPVMIETQWGRGGSASLAWDNPKLITEVTEVTEDEDGKRQENM